MQPETLTLGIIVAEALTYIAKYTFDRPVGISEEEMMLYLALPFPLDAGYA